MDKVLVVGDGLIGCAFGSYLKKIGIPVVSTTRKQLTGSFEQAFLDLETRVWPNLSGYSHAVIAASITGFDACAVNPVMTREVNVNATLALAKLLVEKNCKVVYLSSTAVFSGNEIAPNEHAPYSPVSEYGRQKADIEQNLLKLGENVTVVRLTKVVSLSLPTFARIYEKIRKNENVDVFNNLTISPVSLPFLCDGLIKILESNVAGILHLSNSGYLSYASFAKNLAIRLHADPSRVSETTAPDRFIKSRFPSLGMERTSALLQIYPESIDQMFMRLLKN